MISNNSALTGAVNASHSPNTQPKKKEHSHDHEENINVRAAVVHVIGDML